jgi:beta-galactosidase/beta-glucuronidase
VRATSQDGTYPRPVMCRDQWVPLDGTWEFGYDDRDEGVAQRWFDPAAGHVFAERIEVPFPPESPASGVGRREFHPVVWYARWVRHEDLVPAGSPDQRALLHFGAVDHDATVWVDGGLVARHSGGQTPFAVDVTDALDGEGEHRVVVRAEDDPTDPAQARGKQDWREQTRGIWYDRTTGIWQSVWAESVPVDRVEDLWWEADIAGAALRGHVELVRRPAEPAVLEVSVSLGDELLGEVTVLVQDRLVEVDVPLAALRHGQDRARLLWSPEHPTLVDVSVRLRGRESATVLDEVASYAGLRTVSVDAGGFRLNDQPCYVRSVLNQGYRPDTHLASHGSDQLRAEVEMVKALGFNAVRLHQKAEDPRWLHWADRLGLLVWGEAASAYAFSTAAVTSYLTEWMDLVRRDRSHPCVVTWVPVNESWGVQDIAASTAQQSYARALAEVTRALDPSRPVVSNEGWEHVDSDILGLHDYTADPLELRERYASDESVADVVLQGRTPHGRRVVLGAEQERAFREGRVPVMLTEFGGVSLVSEDAAGDAWGYSSVGSGADYASLLRDLFDAVRASRHLSGFCYTQYMDTGQETNGLLFADGTPKVEVETIRAIVTGEDDSAKPANPGTSTSGWQDS